MSNQFPTIRVNGALVPEEAMMHELSRLVQFYSQHMPEEEIRAQLPSLRKRAIDQAVGVKLLFEEAEKLDIIVREEEIEERFEAMVAEIGGPERFKTFLKQQNLNEATLKDQLMRGRRVDKMVEQITSEAPEPTEEEMRQHFEAHSNEYMQPERVLAQHILITPDGDSPAADEMAKESITSLRQQVVDGTDFSTLAAEHSACPSGREGGSLGWFGRGMMVPEFDEAAFKLDVGEVSEIIKTQFGYHIIYKTDHEEARNADYDDACENIRDFLRHTRRGEILSAHVAELRSKAEIVEE